MTIKLAAMDMDGTLLHDDKSLPKDFIPWVLSHPEIRVVLASGRQYYNLLELFPGMEDKFIFLAENGAMAFDGRKCLHINPMRREAVLLCLQRAAELNGVDPILCGAKSAYMRHCRTEVEQQAHLYYARLKFTDDLEAAAESDDIIKVALHISGGRASEVGAAFCPMEGGIVHTVSGADWIDLGLPENNKGTAMRAVQKYFGILPEECIAFGDFMNDYELLGACTESYAMANGCEELKAAAKYIAPSNCEEGVMQILRQRIG